MSKITCGADPEAFLINIEGQLKSSIGLIGGSKDVPRPLFELGEGYCVQEDNVAIEFNIPPAEGRSQFVESIQRTLNHLTQMVGSQYGLSLSHVSAASFPDQELDNPMAQMFGCEPDYNAWTRRVNPKPKAEDKNLRSCGGHVHVGFDGDKIDRYAVMKQMDLRLGVPSVFMDGSKEALIRKNLYGKAGACRLKPYGAEYRVLSNYWIFTPRLIEWVWDNTEKAVSAAEAQLDFSEEDSQNIINAINSNDKRLAAKLIRKYDLEVLNV